MIDITLLNIVSSISNCIKKLSNENEKLFEVKSAIQISEYIVHKQNNSNEMNILQVSKS